MEENNLTQSISTLRKALGEKRGENRYIVTDPSRGYRFVAPVSRVVEEPAARSNGVSAGEPSAGGETPSRIGRRRKLIALAAGTVLLSLVLAA